MKPLFATLRVLCWLVLVTCPAAGAGEIWQIDVRGAIGPATADHMIRGVEAANAAGAEAIVLGIDTPGGLDT